MLQNAYFLAKIGADTAENEHHIAEILQYTAEQSAVHSLCTAVVSSFAAQFAAQRLHRPRFGMHEYTDLVEL